MYCLVRDSRLESDTGGQKNGQIYKNRNSTVSLNALGGFGEF
ncbi:hypothetical protein ORJ66_02715 [Pseudoalteromonas tunicata]|nr:hypothetical protein [Pseudoalteromonas tunicata]MDP5211954.1 hypothetical protein [Pseudoalteromonas tunicata]